MKNFNVERLTFKFNFLHQKIENFEGALLILKYNLYYVSYNILWHITKFDGRMKLSYTRIEEIWQVVSISIETKHGRHLHLWSE